MKRNTFLLAPVVVSLALMSSWPAVADDAHHPEGAPATQAAPVPAAKPSAQTIQGMQANVKKMQGQLERIAKAKTDDERQKAMAEHLQTMQENMQMARGMQAGMMGCPMMGMMHQGGMGMMGQGGMMMGPGGPAGGAEERMQRMEKRMDMMEMMMKSGGPGMPGMGKP